MVGEDGKSHRCTLGVAKQLRERHDNSNFHRDPKDFLLVEQLFVAFELFAAVVGVPLLGFGLARRWGGGRGVITCATREYHVIYSVFLLLRF